jgi:hypothetical protein
MPRSRHGLIALKARVKVRGLHAIDVRTVAGRALVRWRREMIADLGGEGAVSAAQTGLIEQACRTRLMLDDLDAWLLEQPSLVVKRRRAVLPVLRDRQQLAESLLRTLLALGLERRTPLPSLASHLAGRRSKAAVPVAQPSSPGSDGETRDGSQPTSATAGARGGVATLAEGHEGEPS